MIDVCNEETFLFINNYFTDDFEKFGYKKYDSYDDFKSNFMNDKNNYMNLYNKSYDELYKNITKLKKLTKIYFYIFSIFKKLIFIFQFSYYKF
jgi:hypothetical protein